MRAPFLIAALVLSMLAVQANAMNGNQLWGMAQDRQGIYLAKMYVRGLIDAELAYTAWYLGEASKGAQPPATSLRPVCFPDAATEDQAVEIVLQSLQREPERRHEAVYFIARRALRAAWPCSAE